MKYLILEDEPLSAERLSAMIGTIRTGYTPLAILDSVASAVSWLKNNPRPQLAFFDIQLADGLSFEIFEQIDINFPVIFTTAYNHYAVRAFKVNSIDYLLKPIAEDELRAAIQKFEQTQNGLTAHASLQIENLLLELKQNYKSRFLVKVGDHLKMVQSNQIAFFHSMEKSTFIRTTEGRDFAIDYTLDQILQQINPLEFFRINRSCIIRIDMIRELAVHSSSRLKVIAVQKFEGDLIVSRDRVHGLKEWLER